MEENLATTAAKEPELREEVREPAHVSSENYSEEQLREIEKKAEKAIRDDLIRDASVILLKARQLYTVGLQALSRRCGELNVLSEVESVLVQSMKHAGMQEFTREELMNAVKDQVLPWLVAEIHDQHNREKELVAAEEEAADKARREKWLPLDVTPTYDWKWHSSSGPELPRTESLVFAGHPGAVKWMLDRACQKLLLQLDKPTVLRMIAALKQHNVVRRRDDQNQLFELGSNKWAHEARSLKSLSEALQPFLGFLHNDSVDAVIVDRLDMLNDRFIKSVDRPSWVDAGNAHRHLRKWADEYGCGIIAGIPVGADARSPTTAWEGIELDDSWDQLKEHTHLVQLRVTDDFEDTYKIYALGTGELEDVMTYNKISKAIIDNYQE